MKQLLRDAVFFVPAPFLATYGNSRSFWYDEVHSIYYAHLGLLPMVETLKQDVHSPTYFLILKGWLAIVGEQEFAVRLLPSIFYLLSILVVYGCGRSLYDRKTGLLSGILLMASPLAVMQAHLGRLYSLLCLLAALSIWLSLEIFHKASERRSLYLFFVLVNAAGCLIHIWFFFLLVGELICLIILCERRVLATTLTSLAAIPFLLFWFRFFLVQVSFRPGGMAWLDAPGLFELTLTAFFHGAGISLLAIVAILLRARGKGHSLLSPIFTIFVLTLCAPFIISQFKHIYLIRYTVIALPAFTVWMAALLSRLLSFRNALLWSIVLVLAPTVYLEATWLRNGGEGCNDKWLAMYLTEHSSPTDRIVYVGVQRLPIQYYIDTLPNRLEGYSLPRGIDTHVDYLNRFTGHSDPPDVSEEATPLEMSFNSPVWVVYGHLTKVNQEVEQVFERRFKPTFTRECDCKEAFDYNHVFFARVVRYELSH